VDPHLQFTLAPLIACLGQMFDQRGGFRRTLCAESGEAPRRRRGGPWPS
jgi:hypothetical protein